MMRASRALPWVGVMFLVGAGGVVSGAVSFVDGDDWKITRIAKLSSKRLAIATISLGLQLAPIGDRYGGPLVRWDDDRFEYEDLEHPYLDRIRGDPRLHHFYSQADLDVPDYVAMADFLRGQFPHSARNTAHHQKNLLELLDYAERGEQYSCGTISKMLVQMVQAGGGHGRTVALDDHTVAELWSQDHRKWVVIDADYNVHYSGLSGQPLNAYEVHRTVRGGRLRQITAHPGSSPNTLFSNEKAEALLRRYEQGLLISFYSRWISLDLPRWHPHRSPVVTSVYLGEPDLETRVYLTEIAEDPERVYRPPRSASGASR